jgi:hypothetical protein
MSDELSRLTDALREAAKAVSDAKVPTALREAAFAKGVDYLLRDNSQVAISATGQTPPKPPSDPTDPLGKIAVHLGLDADAVERVYEIENESVHLLVARGDLGDQKKAAVREIAYLVSAARQAADLDEVTAFATLRSVCDQFGVLDGNFATTMSELSGKGLRISGAGHKRAVKINKPGYEAASGIVQRITSGDTK